MEVTTLVLIGKTGNGKSSTGNSILGRKEFVSKRSGKSVTTECKLGQCKWKDGRTINVVDTPGLFDTNATKEFIDQEIVKSIDLAKDGVHGFILVLSLRSRFTEEEAYVIDNLQMLFGPEIIDYMIVLFSGGDELNDSDGFTLDDYITDSPPNLTAVIRRCNSRVVVFDNKTESEREKEDQIAKLLEMVDRNIALKGKRAYSNELFEKAKKMASELYHIRKKEMAYQEQLKQKEEQMKQKEEQMKQQMKEKEELIKLKEMSHQEQMKQKEELIQLKDMAHQEQMKQKDELAKLKDKSNEELKKLKEEEAQKAEKFHADQMQLLNKQMEENAKYMLDMNAKLKDANERLATANQKLGATNTKMGVVMTASSLIPLAARVVPKCSIS